MKIETAILCIKGTEQHTGISSLGEPCFKVTNEDAANELSELLLQSSNDEFGIVFGPYLDHDKTKYWRVTYKPS